MLEAIIAVIATLALIAIALVVFFRIRAGRKGEGPTLAAHASVRSINTVVSASKGSGMLSKDAPTTSSPRGSSGRMSDGLKSRFLAMSLLAGGVFGTLAVKLWSLQILEGSSYRSDAQNNLYTTVYTPAPRGIIYDRNGFAMVNNRTSLTVLADPSVADDHDTVARLSALLGIPFNILVQRIEDSSGGAQSQRAIETEASLRNVSFIVEHSDAFPGVSVDSRTQRNYPYGALAAHAIGYVGTITDDQLNGEYEGRTVQSGDIVGQSGVELAYDDLLAGDHGVRTLVVDSAGNVKDVVSETDPSRGSDLYLTIDATVQCVADEALHDQIASVGAAGSVVAMDCTTGEILALANYPTYLPGTFVGGISQDVWDSFNTDDSYYPLMNRALAGTYPPASTFKPFVGMAGLDNGFITKGSSWKCTGTWTGFGEEYPQKCWLEAGHGTLDFYGAIVNSCDTAFYEVAKEFYNSNKVSETAIQDYVKQFGFESETGIDISGEAVGRIPTPSWKAEYYADAPEEAAWQPGDMSNMSIGQGYVLVTPMQVAVAYGGIATGKLMKPRLLKEVRNSNKEMVVSAESSWQDLQVSEDHLKTVREALRGVVTDNAEIAKLFPSVDAAGKTGTAEFTDKADHGWFACYAPYDDPKYVVACIIEEGVGGSSSAAPVAAKVMNACIKSGNGKLKRNVSFVSSKYEKGKGGKTSTARQD